MADISNEIAKFQNAVYGEEVRGAMVDLCNKVNDETEAGTDTITEYGNAESARATAESKRVSAESARVSAESARVSAESARVSAESARVTEFNNIKSSMTVALTSSGATSSYANTYTIKQGGSSIGTINIPKDQVVTSGTLVTNPTSSLTGDYIKLTIANSSTPVYISVDKLHDIYTGGTTSTIKMAVSSSNVVTGSIVDGSVSKSMLNSDLQTSIANIATNKANIATNTADIATALCGRGQVPKNGTAVDFDSINATNSNYKSGYYANNGGNVTLNCTDGTTISMQDWGTLIYISLYSLQIYVTVDTRVFARVRVGSPSAWSKWRKWYVS